MLFTIRQTDLVGLAPGIDIPTIPETLGLHTFDIPLALPSIPIAMAWHPRNDADGAHRWLRDRVREVVTTAWLAP